MNSKIEDYTNLLLKISRLLMESGTDTNSTQLYLERFASSLNCELEMSATHWAIMISVTNRSDNSSTMSKIKKIPNHGTNFNVGAELSAKSREVEKIPISYEELSDFVEELAKRKHNYHLTSILLLVGFASAGFAYLFGGDWKNMLVTFLASAVGLVVRLESQKKKLNPYFCVGLAALTSCIIAMFGMLFNIGSRPDLAVATCVLYLIPGSIFVASFVDFIEGRVVNGMVRLAHACIISFFIAVAMLMSMTIFNLKVF